MPSDKLSEGAIAERIARIGDQFAINGEFLYGEELCNGHINTMYVHEYQQRFVLSTIRQYLGIHPSTLH